MTNQNGCRQIQRTTRIPQLDEHYQDQGTCQVSLFKGSQMLKIQVDFFLQSKALTRNQELQLQLLLDARIRSVRKLQMRENSRKKVVSLEGKSTETSIRKKSN